MKLLKNIKNQNDINKLNEETKGNVLMFPYTQILSEEKATKEVKEWMEILTSKMMLDSLPSIKGFEVVSYGVVENGDLFITTKEMIDPFARLELRHRGACILWAMDYYGNDYNNVVKGGENE